MANTRKGKASRGRVTVEVSPKDIARALKGIADWVNDVRIIVSKMDPKSRVSISVPADKYTIESIPPPFADGCPPPE